jgi:hypothetical protein
VPLAQTGNPTWRRPGRSRTTPSLTIALTPLRMSRSAKMSPTVPAAGWPRASMTMMLPGGAASIAAGKAPGQP